jgi:hypothetical protein
MKAVIEDVRALVFGDGSPVRSASALAPFAGGWLVAQDDATHAAWLRRERSSGKGPDDVQPVRVLPPVQGLEVFSEAAGTKHLKPDFEAACEVSVNGEEAVVLLGSGATPARMRASLVRLGPAGPRFDVVALDPLYARVADALGIRVELLNLEGACRLGDTVRWFNRGNLAAGLPSASIDLDLRALVASLTGTAAADDVPVSRPRVYELGAIDGVGLAVTDAVALPDGGVLLSAAAEDTPNAVDDGRVVGAALAVVDGDALRAVAPLAAADGRVDKVEGLGLESVAADGLRLLAVVDDDDPGVPSARLSIRVQW